jgi:hypothetical protein
MFTVRRFFSLRKSEAKEDDKNKNVVSESTEKVTGDEQQR